VLTFTLPLRFFGVFFWEGGVMELDVRVHIRVQ
jgi:hypothetical protein